LPITQPRRTAKISALSSRLAALAVDGLSRRILRRLSERHSVEKIRRAGDDFFVVDPTLAPAGKHTLFIWGQYYPYELSNGERWRDIEDREADKLIDVVNSYAPNVKNSIIYRFVQSPLDLEQRLGLLRGNVMHVEMDFDQMFLFRPLPEMSAYKTPIKNLYLTGASTHPGGGVFAASGHNTAQVVLKDVKGSWF
jgi:phytoene dehydrogenase-like protein